VKPVTIQEFTNLALDRAYKRSAGAMLLKIHTLSTDPSSDMVLALNKLQQEAQGLTEQDKPIQTTNPKLKNALNAFGTVMLTAGLLIKENSPAIEATAQAIAIPSVTAKVFLNVSEDLIAKGIDPLGVKAWARLQVAASKTKVPFTIPTTLDYVENYVDSPAWIARMEGWGSGYSARVKDIVEQGIAGGWSPKYTAQAVSEYAQNIPYAAAENLTRTLQLTANRQSSLAMEKINGGMITKKLWISTIDDKTCLTCLSKHGTEIPLGETVNGHYRCRCSEYYVVPGGDEYPPFMQVDSTPGRRRFEKFTTGEEWFAAQSPERQAMQASFLKSPAKFRAYQDGLSLSSFNGKHLDSVFGEQNIELSLKKVLGQTEAEKYYNVNQPKL